MGARGNTKEVSKEITKTKPREPKRYNVVLYNDDFTTMEFVVSILIDIFHLDPVTAENVMMSVHKTGKGVIGSYTYDMAVTKVDAAMARAKQEGFPFRMSVEEA